MLLLLGSPPLTRGPQIRTQRTSWYLGITPAYAGTTARGSKPALLCWDHPRLRGDHVYPLSNLHSPRGSPPLTRGPRWLTRQRSENRGITPAYAGTTTYNSRTRIYDEDHPRLRGDHSATVPAVRTYGGSPPLTRGPQVTNYDNTAYTRITPAYAGTTVGVPAGRGGGGDHPRLRGDHYMNANAFVSVTGSPPLTRGPRPDRYRKPPGTGITPAYAGTTTEPGTRPWATEDHPRLRGDHSPPAITGSALSGSPPLTRGPHGMITAYRAIDRITPAYAGTTHVRPKITETVQDHPRLRGDHRCDDIMTATLEGSPPLTRGPRGRCVFDCARTRITPAYAGTTGFRHGASQQIPDHPRLRGDH